MRFFKSIRIFLYPIFLSGCLQFNASNIRHTNYINTNENRETASTESVIIDNKDCEVTSEILEFDTDLKATKYYKCAQFSDWDLAWQSFENASSLQVKSRIVLTLGAFIENKSKSLENIKNIDEISLTLLSEINTAHIEYTKNLSFLLTKIVKYFQLPYVTKNQVIDKIASISKGDVSSSTDYTNRLLRSRMAHLLFEAGEYDKVLEIFNFENNKTSNKDNALNNYLKWLSEKPKNSNHTFFPDNPQAGLKYIEGYLEGKKFLAYIPTGNHIKYKLLIVIHGTDGSAEAYMNRVFNNACPISICPDGNSYDENYMNQNGIVVITPYFDIGTFHDFDRFFEYSISEKRSDIWMLDVIELVNKKIGSQKLEKDKFYIFGHSKGGQFISAFSMYYSDRIKKAAAAGSGWYYHMFIEPSEWVKASAHSLVAEYSKFLKLPYSIIIGTNDTAENNSNRRRKEAIKQVCNTLKKEPALCSFTPNFDCSRTDYVEGESLHYTSSNNSPNSCNIEFYWVKNGNHNGHHNYPTSAKYLFE